MVLLLKQVLEQHPTMCSRQPAARGTVIAPGSGGRKDCQLQGELTSVWLIDYQ